MSDEIRAAPAGTEQPERGQGRASAVLVAHAEAIALPRRASAEQAFVMIGLSCLRHAAINRAGVLAGSSEALHQMRVGLRRLRAALSLFKPLFAEEEVAKHRQELRWLSGELGLARDYDVFLHETPKPTETEAEAANGAEHPALRRAAILERRQRAFEAARQAVASERTRALFAALANWLVSADWTPASAGQRSARALARAALGERSRRIRKRARRLAKLAPEKRHRLRVAVKKLRYGTEFFAGLFPGSKRPRKRFARRLEKLQELLGQLNDLSVQERLSAELMSRERAARELPSHAPAPRSSADPKPEPAAERGSALLEAAARAAKRLARTPEFWG